LANSTAEVLVPGSADFIFPLRDQVHGGRERLLTEPVIPSQLDPGLDPDFASPSSPSTWTCVRSSSREKKKNLKPFALNTEASPAEPGVRRGDPTGDQPQKESITHRNSRLPQKD
jgi:hypothetical protein